MLFSSQMNNHTYHRFSENWSPIQYTLQVMEDDLKDNLENIKLWKAREEERKTEKPRWTKNDESKYRSAITKLLISNSQGIRELEHHVAVISSLRKSLAERLESTRNQLSFDSAENVKLFTYTTVVFLPLGFTTGLFSMGGAPKDPVLKSMITTSCIALLLTLLVLLNAKALDEVFKGVVWMNNQVLKHVFKPILEHIFKPVLDNIIKPVLDNVIKPVLTDVIKSVAWESTKAMDKLSKPVVGYFGAFKKRVLGKATAAEPGAKPHQPSRSASAETGQAASELPSQHDGWRAWFGGYRHLHKHNGYPPDASAQLEAGTENTST